MEKKIVVLICVFSWIFLISRSIIADEIKGYGCYQGDYVVYNQETADALQSIICIDGNLLWAYGFDVNGHIVTIHAPVLLEVRGWIIIVGSFIQILDFPTLRRAEVIDGSLSGMLQCVEIMRLAYQANATMDPICRGGYLPQ